MTSNEVKKALYKEKPTAVRTGYLGTDKENDERYKYEAVLKDSTILKFVVPFNEMGETLFGVEEPAQLLIRWLIPTTPEDTQGGFGEGSL